MPFVSLYETEGLFIVKKIKNRNFLNGGFRGDYPRRLSCSGVLDPSEGRRSPSEEQSVAAFVLCVNLYKF